MASVSFKAVRRATLSAALCFASGANAYARRGAGPEGRQAVGTSRIEAARQLLRRRTHPVQPVDGLGHDRIASKFSQGEITVDQMYVQFQVPMDDKRLPIVFVHGCCLSSKTWETTPDGRMGWFEYFTRKGFPTYLADQVGRARSGFDATPYNQVRAGQLPTTDQAPMLMAGAPFAWQAFRFGPSVGVPWPDEQFPLNKFGELSKQAIPDLILTTLVPRDPANLFPELGNPHSDLADRHRHGEAREGIWAAPSWSVIRSLQPFQRRPPSRIRRGFAASFSSRRDASPI